MRWPDIFFKAKKKPQNPVLPPPFVPPPSDPAPTLRGPHTGALAPLPESTGGGRQVPILAIASQAPTPPLPTPPVAPKATVSQAMAEADPLRALTQSGGVRLTKRVTLTETPPASTSPATPSPETPAPSVEKAAPHPEPSLPSTPKMEETEAYSFILPPSATFVATGKDTSTIKAPTPISLTKSSTVPLIPPGTTMFRRKAKLADVARIVLPPKRDDHEHPRPSEPHPTVVPPAFSVSVPAGSLIKPQNPEPAKASPSSEQTSAPESDAAPVPNMPDSPVMEAPVIEAPKAEPPSNPPASTDITSSPIPEETPAAPVLQVDPEAHKEKPPVTSIPIEHLPAPSPSAEKCEFVLTNGERILGHILSETPEALYIDHATLGVLTIPRSQIAKRPIEIILINGDRVVGDVVAETPECLFVRHASLGMLTVPHNQRSTRVVEAILKDGDRILGEVLAETENFTVIRSATLGTVAVPHGKVAMLNRKIEQIQLKALPPAIPEIKDKPAE